MQNQTRNLVIVALVAALVAVTCWKQSPGQGEAPRPAAATPEYMVVRLGDHEDVASSALREYSQQRWEVCSTYSRGEVAYCVLRRPKAAK